MLSVLLDDVKQMAQKLGSEFRAVFARNHIESAVPDAEICDGEMSQRQVGNHVKAE